MDASPGLESDAETDTETDTELDTDMDLNMERATDRDVEMRIDSDTNTSIDEDAIETTSCSSPNGHRLENLPNEILDLIGDHLDKEDIRPLRDLGNRNICDGFSRAFVSKPSFIIARRTDSGVDETQLLSPEMYDQRRKYRTSRYHIKHAIC
jgi:hypothetical protein